MDRLGEWGLRLLIATLCVTPLATTLRKPWIMGLRRMLGLFAFAYLLLHFLHLARTRPVVRPRTPSAPTSSSGRTSRWASPRSLMLVPLAITSTAGWMRRLGPRWHRLHRLVYPAAILGVAHFWWQVKADWREPAVYAVLLAGLLAWRVRRARREEPVAPNGRCER